MNNANMSPLNNIGKGREEEREVKVCSKLKVTDDVCLKEQRRKIQSSERQV